MVSLWVVTKELVSVVEMELQRVEHLALLKVVVMEVERVPGMGYQKVVEKVV